MTKLFKMEPSSAVSCKLYSAADYKIGGTFQANCSPLGAPWGDCLPAKDEYSPMLVSGRVAKSIADHGLSGLTLEKVEARAGRKVIEVREYYIATPVLVCPPLLFRLWKKINGSHSFVMESSRRSDFDDLIRGCDIPISSWRVQKVFAGSELEGDFMKAPDRESGVFHGGGFLCSRRVVGIAYREKWTSLGFTPIDSLGGMTANIGDFI
jgi:hypothetical protein